MFSGNASVALENTALYVLVGAALPDLTANHHAPPQDYKGPYADGNEFGVEGWVPVTATRGQSSHTLTVDLTALGGRVPTAVRYASGEGGWGGTHNNRMCCGPQVDIALQPCPPASCPHKGSGMGALPGGPFVAAIEGGKCACTPPRVCDT